MIGDADTRCIAGLREADSWGPLRTDEIFRADIGLSAFDKVLADSEPGMPAPRLPVLLAQGGQDRVIQSSRTRLLNDQLTAGGVDVTSLTYPYADRRGVLAASLPDVTRWVDGLFARG